MSTWGGGLVWGTGTWTASMAASTMTVDVPYKPTHLTGIALIPSISKTTSSLGNANFTSISAQPNILGNEIDIFITNPGLLTGTLVRSMYRYPLNSEDGYTIFSSSINTFIADYGLFPDRMYYYTFFPDNDDSPISVSCRSTEYSNLIDYMWNKALPGLYRERDSEVPALATLTVTVVANTLNNTRFFQLTDVTNLVQGQLIQINDQFTYVRLIDYSASTVIISPSLSVVPQGGQIVIIQGLGYPFFRFLSAFAEQLDYVHDRIKNLLADRQVANCDDQYLPNFAQYVGLGQLVNTGNIADVSSSRRQIENAVPLWKTKGTYPSIYSVVETIVGPSYKVLIDDMRDMLMFTNAWDTFTQQPRNDNTFDPTNSASYAKAGKYGDPSRYTIDNSNGPTTVYTPFNIRITIEVYSDFSLIAGYTNLLVTALPQYLPVGVDYYLLWDTTAPTINLTGSGYGITFKCSAVSTP
jgi:hypothetical protein